MEKKTLLELKFKKAWAWPKKVEDYYSEQIKDKHSCHVFCGSSELGDGCPIAVQQNKSILFYYSAWGNFIFFHKGYIRYMC